MKVNDLETMLFTDPFRPFRITISSGDAYVVNNRQRAMVAGPSLVLGLNKNPRSRIGNRLKIISIPSIVRAEHLGRGG